MSDEQIGVRFVSMCLHYNYAAVGVVDEYHPLNVVRLLVRPMPSSAMYNYNMFTVVYVHIITLH